MNTVIAAAIALGTTSAPVMADDRTERIIAGAILLGILGAAVNDAQQDDRAELSSRRITTIAPERAPRRIQQQRSRALPAACLRGFRTNQGRVRLFDGNCLERSFRGYHRLPRECAVRIRNHGRLDTGFRPRCLSSAGFGLAGR